MNASLSPTFLAELAEVYATMHRPPLSAEFLADLALVHATLPVVSDANFLFLAARFHDWRRVTKDVPPLSLSAEFLADLAQVHATLPVASDANLLFLANRFHDWRRVTKEFVRIHRAKLHEDDPLLCRVSLFRTMDYGRLETAHTRTLAWLLHPEREHGFGKTLLAALLRRLSGDECSDTLRVNRVESEFLIDGCGAKGRLDLLAEGAWDDAEQGGWVLVIEAKVEAAEGEDPLLNYEPWLQANAAGRKVFRVFLTPDGRPPDTGKEKWEPLSFLELARIFQAVYAGLRQAPGFHFLRFYLAGVLQDVCGLPRNVGEDAEDPYAVASYLKSVQTSH
jgi:hypothetical protein